MLSTLKGCGSKIQSTYFTKSICRTYMKISEKMELLYKRSDKVSRSYELIYRYPQEQKLSFLYHSANFMSFMSIANIITGYYKGTLPEVIENSFQLGVLVTFIGFIFILSQKLRTGFPLRIYCSDQDNHNIAVFMSIIPFVNENFQFPKKSVTFVKNDSQHFLQHLRCQSKNRRLYLQEENFKTHNDFYKLLKL